MSCSGGVFSAKWERGIAISKTIYVVGGTNLNVTGAGSGEGMGGGFDTRLFTVINASLHVTDLSLRFSSTTVGGAVATSASQLTLSKYILRRQRCKKTRSHGLRHARDEQFQYNVRRGIFDLLRKHGR